MNKFLPFLLAGILCVASPIFGSTIFTNLYSFSPFTQTNAFGLSTNVDGAQPTAGLIISGSTLFGATSEGGTNGTGTLFKMNTDGSAYTVLYQFSDGGKPAASLVLAGNNLYGTTEDGGTNGSGSIFEINTNGSDFTNLYNFTELMDTNALGDLTNGDGANPTSGLTLIGSGLYGTASAGGNNGNGAIFEINTDGTGFTNLYNFSAGNLNFIGNLTNSDGANPYASLAWNGNMLYGTTEFGGAGASGTVFGISTNGTEFTNLYSFSAVNDFTNSDGAFAFSGVTPSGAELFGATLAGGLNHNGTLYAVSMNGGGYTNLYTFSSTANNITNSDGAKPASGLLQIGSNLYGTTQLGGAGGSGTIFSISTNGLNFTNLYSFTAVSSDLSGVSTNSDGGFPQAGLVMSENSFYGTTLNAGMGGNGGIYVFSLGPIPIHIHSINRIPVVSWGNPAFSLMAATNVNGTYSVVPGATSPFTNNFSSPREFFSLQAF